ncbi:MAG: hypothetical protein ABI643_02885 [Candidatus Doudnabacteria bacterium]
MNTDFQNLNVFESSAVFFITIGIFLITTILFSGLNFSQQNNVIRSLSVLDIHQQVGESLAEAQLILSGEEEFYNQFYIAFTEIAVLPADVFEAPGQYIKLAYNGLADYSDQFVYGYEKRNSYRYSFESSGKSARAGIVAGAMIDEDYMQTTQTAEKCPQTSAGPPKAIIPYSFAPPEWQSIKQSIINTWSQKILWQEK